MSQSFTTPAGATWQTLLNEITLAYSERRQAIRQSAYVPEDRDVQSSAYWRTLQSWMETYCTSFVDHTNVTSFDPAGRLEVNFFNTPLWRSAAGLHEDGFRRSPLTGGTAYGQMQIGDAIGPWIFEDIQKGLGALQQVPYFSNIESLRKAGYVSGIMNISAYGGGTNWQGIQYPDTYNDLYIISAGDVDVKNCSHESPLGYGDKSLIGLATSGVTVDIMFDKGPGTAGSFNNYYLKLTLQDAAYVSFYPTINWRYFRCPSKSASASGGVLIASAVLGITGGDGDYAMFNCSVSPVKVPFTNA